MFISFLITFLSKKVQDHLSSKAHLQLLQSDEEHLWQTRGDMDRPYHGRFGPGHESHEDIDRGTVHCRARWGEGKKYSCGHFQLCSVNMTCGILKKKKKNLVSKYLDTEKMCCY